MTLRTKLLLWFIVLHLALAAGAVLILMEHQEWLFAVELGFVVSVVVSYRMVNALFVPLELIRTGVVNETEQGFSITQLAYRLGDAKITDVIFQQRSLIDAQLAQVAAEAELAAARAQLDLTLGMLNNEIL